MDDIPAALLADAHIAPSPLIVECCGTPQNADHDYLSPAKFMRLGPLKSDSYCDSDDKTQPVQLLVKQRSGSQSVDRLAEAPQSFAHDSKHCNHPNPLLSRPNNQSESNRNNNHKAQCKSWPKTNKRLTCLEYAKTLHCHKSKVLVQHCRMGAGGHSTPLRFPDTIAAPPTQLTANRK